MSKPTGKLAFAYQSISMLELENKRLKEENESLRKALKTIREESHDIGACECAADALVDAGRRV